MPETILVMDSDGSLLEEVHEPLTEAGYFLVHCLEPAKALHNISSQCCGALLMNQDLGELDAVQFLRMARRTDPDIAAIIASYHASVDSVVEAIKEGASHYLQRPVQESTLLESVSKALEGRCLKQKSRVVRREVIDRYNFCNLISKSSKMKRIFELIQRIGPTDSTVFISGETGVGKELVARAIHENSHRKHMPLLVINCGALTESLLESELFGHEKGAFTGAYREKQGKFEFAHKGTLFLDEVGDISKGMQVKLLRALQEKKVTPVGGNRSVEVDVRLISATNQSIQEKIKTHAFRIDLFYRLNVIPIHIPPLRERTEDIPLLAQHFLDELNRSLQWGPRRISAKGMKQLLEYSWPGNVRELENVLERAYITEDSKVIDHFVFPHSLSLEDGSHSAAAASPVDTDIPFGAARSLALKRFELAYLTEALRRYGGNVSETAQKVGVNPRTLWRKISEYGLDRAEFKRKREK